MTLKDCYQRIPALLLVIAGTCGLPTAFAQAGDRPDRPGILEPDTGKEPTRTVEDLVRDAMRALDDAYVADTQAETEKAVERARKLYDEIVARDPNADRLDYIKGALYVYSNQHLDALTTLEAFTNTRLGKVEWKAYRMLGDLLLLSDFPKLAESKYKEANKLNPDDPYVMLGMSVCAGRLGEPEDAVALIEKSLQRAPAGRRKQFLKQAAQTHMAVKNFDKAANYAAELCERLKTENKSNPGHRETITALQATYTMRVSIAKAMLAEKPEQTSLYLDMADYTLERGGLQSELAYYDVLSLLDLAIASEENSVSIELLERKAEILAHLKRTEEARNLYESILKKNPRNKAAKEFMAQFAPSEAATSEKTSPTATPPGDTTPTNSR